MPRRAKKQVMTCHKFAEIAAWAMEPGRLIEEGVYLDWLAHGGECLDCRHRFDELMESLNHGEVDLNILVQRICLQTSVLEALAKQRGATVQSLPKELAHTLESQSRQLVSQWEGLDAKIPRPC